MKIKDIKKMPLERCMLLIEDLEVGDIQRVYNPESIKSYKKIYDKDNYIIIKNPTQEQKDNILKMLISSGDGDITKSKLTELELMTNIIPMLTDLDFNVNRKSDVKKLKELLNPNSKPKIINELDKELGKILNSIVQEWIDLAETISQLPEQTQDLLLNEIQQKGLEDKIKNEENKIEEIKEVLDNANV